MPPFSADLPRRVAVVGTGLIGSSWTALFLARGLDVAATDPAPGAEERLHTFLDRAWPVLERIGLAEGASRSRLTFFTSLERAVEGAQFVQENGPEREDYKVRVFAELDRLLPAEVLLATSSSGLTMSAIQRDCAHPERCLIGHPFNPPHLIPLVELVGGKATSPGSIERADAFYTSLGKRTIRLRKEMPGHVANRLQAALWREAVHLVAEGVVTVAEVDRAVAAGPGLRWALMGPNLIFHLGGGDGGIEHFMEHLSGPFTQWWRDLGNPELTAALKEKLIAQTLEEAAGETPAALGRKRDHALLELIAVQKTADLP